MAIFIQEFAMAEYFKGGIGDLNGQDQKLQELAIKLFESLKGLDMKIFKKAFS